MSTKFLQQTLHANKTIQRLLSMDHMPYNMGVSKNRGGPPKWMVKIMVPNPIQMDDLGGKTTTIFGSTPIYQQTIQPPATNQVAMTHPHIVATIGNHCFPLLLYQPVSKHRILVEISCKQSWESKVPPIDKALLRDY